MRLLGAEDFGLEVWWLVPGISPLGYCCIARRHCRCPGRCRHEEQLPGHSARVLPVPLVYAVAQPGALGVARDHLPVREDHLAVGVSLTLAGSGILFYGLAFSDEVAGAAAEAADAASRLTRSPPGDFWP